jgi:hypothetical protein
MPGSIYKSREGETEIQALYDEAPGGLGLPYESLTVGTRVEEHAGMALKAFPTPFGKD